MNEERLETIAMNNVQAWGTPIWETPRVGEARIWYADARHPTWTWQAYDWNEIGTNHNPYTLTWQTRRRSEDNLDYVFVLIDNLEKRIDRLERDLIDTENELVKKIRELQQATGFKYIEWDDYDW